MLIFIEEPSRAPGTPGSCQDPAQPKHASLLLQLADSETLANGSSPISYMYFIENG